MPGGDREGGEPGRSPAPQGCDGTRGRQGPAHPVRVLFARRGHCDQGAEHGPGLGRSQGRVGEGVRAAGRVEDIRGTREQEPRGVGEDRRGGGAVAVAVPLERCESIFAVPPRPVAVGISGLGCRRLAGGDDTTRRSARGPDCGFDTHPPRLLPRGCSRGAGLRDPAARGRRRAIGTRPGRALLEEGARLLPDRGGLAEQHRMASHAAAASGPAPRGAPREDCGGRDMPVATDEESGRRPVAPQIRQPPDEAPRVRRAGRALPGAEARGDQGVGGPCTNAPWQRALTLGVVVRAGQCLLPRWGGLGVIAVEDQGRGGRGGARHTVGNKRRREAGEGGAGPAVCEPGAGRGTRQVRQGRERDPLQAQWKQRSVPERIGSIAVRLSRSALIAALGAQVPQEMGGLRRLPFVTHGSGQAVRAAALAVDSPQSEGATVGRQGPSVDIGPHGRPRKRRKTPVVWSRIPQKQTSCSFYGRETCHTLFYQRLVRGLCLFMNNSG
jgi:hypothetical protein